MARNKRKMTVPSPVSIEFNPAPDPGLKKQSRYGNDPWKPGEIPVRTGAMIPVIEPLNAARAPYGEFMGVERPARRGNGKPREGQP